MRDSNSTVFGGECDRLEYMQLKLTSPVAVTEAFKGINKKKLKKIDSKIGPYITTISCT